MRTLKYAKGRDGLLRCFMKGNNAVKCYCYAKDFQIVTLTVEPIMAQDLVDETNTEFYDTLDQLNKRRYNNQNGNT